MKAIMTLFSVAVIMISSGCARVEKVVAVEGDLDIPFDSLGILEVTEPAANAAGQRAVWTGVEVLSLSLANTPTRPASYKAMLRKKLARVARDRYGAHRVINVEYWPDPALKTFPDGKIHARGEMIKYHPFPEKPPAS